MKAEIERRIHDYLDGRLSDDEKAEFEKRMAGDAGLSERVEEYRQIGSALRDETEELSPGFYTRARANFENPRDSGVRHGFHLISWETAGLVAATGLAIAVFVPGLMQDSPALPQGEVQQTDATSPAATGLTSAPDDAPAQSAEPERQKKKSFLNESDSAASRAVEPPPPATKLDEGAARSRKNAPEKEKLEFAPPGAPAGSELRSEERVAGERLQARTFADAVVEESIEGFPADARPLPPGTIAAGDVRVVARDEHLLQDADDKDAETFREEKRSAGRADTLGKSVAAPVSGGRRVWIGPREPAFSCVGIVLLRSEEVWVIVLARPTDGRPAAESGCEVSLPDDGVDFRIEGPVR